jgi:hypothetical protein
VDDAFENLRLICPKSIQELQLEFMKKKSIWGFYLEVDWGASKTGLAVDDWGWDAELHSEY